MAALKSSTPDGALQRKHANFSKTTQHEQDVENQKNACLFKMRTRCPESKEKKMQKKSAQERHR